MFSVLDFFVEAREKVLSKGGALHGRMFLFFGVDELLCSGGESFIKYCFFWGGTGVAQGFRVTESQEIRRIRNVGMTLTSCRTLFSSQKPSLQIGRGFQHQVHNLMFFFGKFQVSQLETSSCLSAKRN